MGTGEIARYEQFLLFPQCFQKACFPGASTGVIVWEWVKTKDCLAKGLFITANDFENIVLIMDNLFYLMSKKKGYIWNVAEEKWLFRPILNCFY